MEELLKQLLATPEGISVIIAQYKPMAYAICKELFDIYKDLVNNDEWFVVNAKYDKKRFDALVNEGFTEEQAMQIIITKMQEFKNSAKKTSSASVKLNG